VWLIVYVALPPAVLCTIALHSLRLQPEDRVVDQPLLVATRTVLWAVGAAGLRLGIWLTAAPGILESVWPWKLTDLPASIVGTWLITVAAGCAWALRDGSWSRCRIVLWPCLLALVLHLVAVARLHGTLLGGGAPVAVYVAALALAFAGLFAVGILEERGLRAR
jgi:hypothetical protein